MSLGRSMLSLLCLSLFSFVRVSFGLGATDTITWGGDTSRAGYETGHNLDPAIVRSDSFGQLFRTALPGNFNGIGAEQIFSQPLVYTGSDGTQYVYLATTQNNVYKLDAKTGEIIARRNLHVPFLTADLDGCVDINPTIGVTATGVIDPASGIWYLTAKTYSEEYQDGRFSPQATPGRLEGRYYFHAIHTEDLSEAAGFPTLIDGTLFRNNPERMFIGGNQHQRPALLHVGQYIYTGWASHCVQYNFTGAIIGFNKDTGAIVEAFATEAGPEPVDIKGGGVWMSGGGLAYDGRGSMYFSTGNGYASQLPPTGNPVQGRNPPSSLEEAAVNAKVNDDGTITVVDFFMPKEKNQLDGADQDLGTSPLQILPSDTFSCPQHRRIGVVTGKSGKTYWLNLDDLGGYQTAPNEQDNVIQVFQNENSVYAGAGVMPLGGGYIAINVIKFQTHIFKFSCNGGKAVFTHVADTAEKNAYILGVGHGATTSLDGRADTAMLWTTDVEGQNLRIYNAIPPSNGGYLELIRGFNIVGTTKFSRPVFGDGRAYVGTTTGYLYAFGSPVNLPLNCSSPYTFPKISIGNVSEPLTVTCRAKAQTSVQSLNFTGNANFRISNLPTTPLSLNAGQTFSFQAVFAPKSVGPLSSDVIVNTGGNAQGYASTTPITLKGTANSASALLSIVPKTISFNLIAGQSGATQSAVFSNDGDSTLTLTNISYSTVSQDGPWTTPETTANGSMTLNFFTLSGIPNSVAGNSQAVVSVAYNPEEIGGHSLFVKVSSNGGAAELNILGRAASQPQALFEFEKPDGTGWAQYAVGQPFTFGNVTEGTTRSLRFRVTNNGSSSAAALSLTVSKPPFGVPGIVGAANNVDLAEGTSIAPGASESAVLFCAVPKRQVNLPSYYGQATWTINTNTGDDSGKQTITFACNAVSEQLGPLLPNGTAQFPYIGCFRENNPNRQLAVQVYASADGNENGRCIDACYERGYIFAGTQYHTECWCGNTIPKQKDLERDCNFPCSGDGNQTCGGDGYFHDTTEISLFADSTLFDGNTTSPDVGIPKTVGEYGYVGCFAEEGAKTFNAKVTTSGQMTVQACQQFCQGSTLFGLQYASECYCGETIAPSSTKTTDDQCNMNCLGSARQFCGAGNRMQVYRLNGASASSSSAQPTVSSSAAGGNETTSVSSTSVSSSAASTSSGAPTGTALADWTSLGCYSEVPGRALQGKATAGNTMTNEVCATFCSGYKYFATEYASECYCGNTLVPGSEPVTDGRCNMPCAANSKQICGGPNGLSLHQTKASPSSGSSRTASSSAGPSTTTSKTPTGPTVVLRASGYASLGCHSEVPNGRALPNLYANNSMTIEICAAQAAKGTYRFFGVEYGSECWYGNVLAPEAQPIDQSRCGFSCPGDAGEYCGAGNSLQLYRLAGDASASASSTTGQLSTVASSFGSTATSASSPTAQSDERTIQTSTSTSAASSTSAVTSTSTASSTTSSATTRTSSTTSTSASASTTPLACPKSNGTVYQTSNATTTFNFIVECYLDHAGGDMRGAGAYVGSLEDCVGKCANATGCSNLAWLPGKPTGACYWKDRVGQNVTNNGVWGARLLNMTDLLR